MKQINLFSMVLCSAVAPQAALAQAPSLEQKQALPTQLLTNQNYSSNEVSVSKLKTVIPGKEYTLEVKGKINSGSGRGLDVVANDANGQGFRVSLDAKTLNWNNPMGTLSPLSSTDNTKTRTLRFAVADKKVNIYEDGYYICTRPIETIAESITAVDDAKPNVNPEVIPASDWGSSKPTPQSKGWNLLNDGKEVTSWPNARFEVSPTTMKALHEDGSEYKGNIFVIRWDADDIVNYQYVYEVELAANTTYEFSMDCAYWSNRSNGSTMTAKVADNKSLTSPIASHTFGTSTTQKMIPGSFTFKTTHAGKYYIAFNGQRAMFVIGNLKLIAENSGDMMEYAIPTSWTDKPAASDMGWKLTDGTKEVTSWPNARYETSPSNKILNADGSAFEGNHFLVRWDNNSIKNDYYTYPVYLQKGVKYELDLDAASYSNFNKSKGTENVQGIKVWVSSDSNVSSSIANTTIYTGNNDKKLAHGKLSFTPEVSGQYYVALRGAWGLFSVANLSLTGQVAEPMVLIGKNYEGEASMEVSSATFDETGAFAPAEKTGETTNLNITDAGNVEKGFLFNSTINVSGKTNLHLVADETPFEKTTIDLKGDDAWLYFDYVKPSKVIANFLSDVKINGQAAQNGVNCRISVWANGAVIIPNGPAYDKKALVAYDGENFTGNSKEFEIDTYHNDLGEWDNKIKSFKLKRGYMATLANNANGTGYSRVFIANDKDLEISSLPEGMENFVSFVRVFRWNWPSKKGKANGYGEKDLLNITCNYDWNVGGKSDDPDVEYTPIRQNLGWPYWNDINNKKGVNHLLGCNEPDRPDQSNCTVDQVIQMWPEMLKSGYRLGSPAPSSVGVWNGDFFNKIEKYGYRCDFAVAHIYESTNASTLVSRLKTLSDKGKGRPVWITEWNNGANWTNEGWPTTEGPQCDADSNPILDENGNTKTVKHPLSAENAEKQKSYMEAALPALDNSDLIERYFEYDWVQDCRALVINGKLTPAGKVYAAHKSALAYKDLGEKSWEKWKICPPYPVQSIDQDFRNITIKWYDHNGETGKKYILERKMDDATDYTVCKEFYLDKDYKAGETVTFTEAIPCSNKVIYRIKALSYKDKESAYSDERTFTRDAAVAAPVLKGEAISTSINKISWDAVSGAKSYRLERAENKDGEYQVIADNLTATEYEDKDLKVNTTYYYRAYSLNSAAERPVSEVLAVTTRAFVAPEAMTGVKISGGSASASLRWNFAYDTYYKVYRATQVDGEYKEVADKVDATYYVDENLVNGLTYYYKVKPYNEAGEGETTDILTATPQAGKYMHIAFDENQGDVAYDEWGGYDGKFVDGTSFDTGRNGGHAAKLVKSSKSYIEMPEGVVSRLEDFTIATWIKMPGGKGRVFDFGSNTSTAMYAQANGTGVRWKITCEKGTFDYTAPFKWDATNWHHLVFVKDGTTMTVYFDGEKAGSAENEGNVCPKDLGVTTRNWLGRSQWSSDAYCDHVYDDFRIYDCALSADNVKNLFADKELVLNPQYARSVKADSWNTVCLPYAATPATGVSAYTIAGVDEGKTKLYLSPVSDLTAGVPYIFHSANEVAVFAENGEAVDAPVDGANGLKGVFESAAGAVKNGSYILKDNTWYKVDNETQFNLGDNRAYITGMDGIGLSTATAKSMPISAGTVTGINHVEANGADGTGAYTLQGIKAKKDAKGVLIKNGKKQIKK